MKKNLILLTVPFLCSCSFFPYGISKFRFIKEASELDIVESSHFEVEAKREESFAKIITKYDANLKDYVVSKIKDQSEYSSSGRVPFDNEANSEMTQFLNTYFFIDKNKLYSLFPEEDIKVKGCGLSYYEFVILDNINEPDGSYKSFQYKLVSGRKGYLLLNYFSHYIIKKGEPVHDTTIISYFSRV